jgi:hypothetical protein
MFKICSSVTIAAIRVSGIGALFMGHFVEILCNANKEINPSIVSTM